MGLLVLLTAISIGNDLISRIFKKMFKISKKFSLASSFIGLGFSKLQKDINNLVKSSNCYPENSYKISTHLSIYLLFIVC